MTGLAKNASVTVVVSTYNRPDTLEIAIRSVLRQSFQHWILLVIGDHCDDRTRAVVDSFQDDRVSYINLPVRCGEQSGPNSVGIALAQTEYLAFLNHDDILVPDHLEYGLARLSESSGDFFVGQSILADESVDCEEGGCRPLFYAVSATERNPADCMRSVTDPQAYTFEPSSSWIIRTDRAKAVGHWKRRGDTFVISPLQEWVRRAWQRGLRFVYGQKVTVLKMRTHDQKRHQATGAQYLRESLEHRYVMERWYCLDADRMRLILHCQLETNQALTARLEPALFEKVAGRWREESVPRFGWRLLVGAVVRVRRKFGPTVMSLAGFLFLKWDLDLLYWPNRLVAWRHGLNKANVLRRVVLSRTGESLGRQYEIDQIVSLTLRDNGAASEPGGHRLGKL